MYKFVSKMTVIVARRFDFFIEHNRVVITNRTFV
jgi:hypothetical protein